MLETGLYERVRRLLLRTASLDLGDDRHYLVETRLAQPGALGRWPSLAALVDAAESGHQEARRRIIEALVTTETFFFRDQPVFDALRTRLLPTLFEQVRGRRIELWSAASSSGQEAYSIAILVATRFPSLRSRVHILASDISEAMVGRVQRALYSDLEVRRGLRDDELRRAFVEASGGWQVREEIRALVEARVINLADPLPAIGPFDMVFLRNVLIYVPPSSRGAILARVVDRLRPGGFLVLGNGESLEVGTFGLDRLDGLRAPIYVRRGRVCPSSANLRDSVPRTPQRGVGGGQS